MHYTSVSFYVYEKEESRNNNSTIIENLI
jgi:hypothetical protein